MLVVVSHEVIDLGHQFLDAAEGATPDGFLGDVPEETLHLIQPGTVGGNEMDVPARPQGEPGFHTRVLVGAVVVHDQMDVETLRHALLDAPQEGEELLMAVARLASGEHRAAEHVERRTPCAFRVSRLISTRSSNDGN